MKKLIALFVFALFCAPSAFAETSKMQTSKMPANGEFGNHCAWGLTMGKQISTDCSVNWKDSTSGKIYCFSSEAFKTDWAKNTASNTAKASAEFTKLSKASTTEPATH